MALYFFPRKLESEGWAKTGTITLTRRYNSDAFKISQSNGLPEYYLNLERCRPFVRRGKVNSSTEIGHYSEKKLYTGTFGDLLAQLDWGEHTSAQVVLSRVG